MDLMKHVKFLAIVSIAVLAWSVPAAGMSMFAAQADCCWYLHDRMIYSMSFAFSHMIYQFIGIILLLFAILSCR